MKLRLAVPLRRAKRGRRRPAEQAPRTIVPVPVDRFDAARERLKRQIPPRED